MILLAALLAFLSFPAWAGEEHGHGVSAIPTPLSSELNDYESLIEIMPDSPAPAAQAAPAPDTRRVDAQGRLLPSRHLPRSPSVRIQQGNSVFKRGVSHENGVMVYRGIAPAQR